jgi:hypothetical protein
MAHFDADNVVFQYKPLGGASNTWKTLVCEENLSATLSRAISERTTKCRIIKSTSQISGSITGTSVAETAPDADQATLKDVLDAIAANTSLEGRIINLASGAINEGDMILVRGEGIFSDVNPSANAGGQLDFGWTFQITGDVDVDESDESGF